MEGGLDGDDNDKDDDNDKGGGHDDNDDGVGHDDGDDGGWGGWGGHHQMRKGREHDDRQKHNNQLDHRRVGEDGGDNSDDDNEDDDKDDDEATERPWLWYGHPLRASAQRSRWRLVDGASASTTRPAKSTITKQWG